MLVTKIEHNNSSEHLHVVSYIMSLSMDRYVSIILTLLACAVRSCNATCFYTDPNGGPTCNFLDLSKPCNTCSVDTDNLANAIPATIAVDKIFGACGCVVQMHDTCDSIAVSAPDASSYLVSPCARTGQEYINNIINSEPCNGCDVAPAPDASAPGNPASDTPTPATVTSTTAPTPATGTPTPAPTAPSKGGGGTSCIARDQEVFVKNQGKTSMSNLKIGDEVLTHQGFRGFMGYIHEGSFQPTLIIKTGSGSVVELTEDHLIKTGNSYVHAKYVKVGDQLSSGEVSEITSGTSFVVSPLTRSGTIIVNNVVLSCYANVLSHNVANFALAPLRANFMKGIFRYFSTLVAVYNASPKWFRHLIVANDSIVL